MEHRTNDLTKETPMLKPTYRLYRQLSRKSKEVFLRVKEGQEVTHDYRPRRDLVRRLARNNNMDEGSVISLLNWERRELLKTIGKCKE